MTSSAPHSPLTGLNSLAFTSTGHGTFSAITQFECAQTATTCPAALPATTIVVSKIGLDEPEYTPIGCCSSQPVPSTNRFATKSALSMLPCCQTTMMSPLPSMTAWGPIAKPVGVVLPVSRLDGAVQLPAARRDVRQCIRPPSFWPQQADAAPALSLTRLML